MSNTQPMWGAPQSPGAAQNQPQAPVAPQPPAPQFAAPAPGAPVPPGAPMPPAAPPQQAPAPTQAPQAQAPVQAPQAPAQPVQPAAPAQQPHPVSVVPPGLPGQAAPQAPHPQQAQQQAGTVPAGYPGADLAGNGAQIISTEQMRQRQPEKEKPEWYKRIESQIMLWAELNVSDIQMVSDSYVWIVDEDNHQPTSMYLTRDDILLLADYWVPGNPDLGIKNGAQILVDGEEGMLETVQNLGMSFSSDVPQPWRARIIFRRQENGLGVTMRLIPPKVPTLDKYPQPPQIMNLLKENNGLFIVSGPTGSGKTTLLAALINEYNENNHRHIYTIEDPIEFVHLPKKCLITQREVGRDSDSWAGGIMAAVRSKAQVILIGELRELDAIVAALDAANKGHLVFATSHASSAAQCVEGIVSQFPGDQQNLVQNRLAEVLKCVMVQRLVPTVDGKLTAVREIMLDHTTTTPRIRSGHFTELTGALKEEDGMISFEMSLFKLYEAGVITEETALKYANIKDDLLFRIERLKTRRAESDRRPVR